MKIRQKEIETWKKVGIDKETYKILREQKKKQQKSMMRIIKNLVEEKYANATLPNMPRE